MQAWTHHDLTYCLPIGLDAGSMPISMVLMTDSRPLLRSRECHIVEGWVNALLDRFPVGGGQESRGRWIVH